MIPVMRTYNRRNGTRRKLLATDFEGTLLEGEMMEALGCYLDGEFVDYNGSLVPLGDYMKRITELGMTGRMPFGESLRLRFETLADLMPLKEMQDVVAGMPLRRGAREALRAIEDEYDVAIITGGIHPLVECYLKRNGIEVDYHAASGAGIVDGKVARVYPLIDKLEPVQRLKEEVRYRHIVAMGDGATDRAMKKVAGRFIWVCPKPGLAEDGDIVLGNDLSSLPAILLNTG